MIISRTWFEDLRLPLNRPLQHLSTYVGGKPSVLACAVRVSVEINLSVVAVVLQLLSVLQTLESDMQMLQDNVHKLLELVEDFSDT